jgi:hypothetical protein
MLPYATHLKPNDMMIKEVVFLVCLCDLHVSETEFVTQIKLTSGSQTCTAL